MLILAVDVNITNHSYFDQWQSPQIEPHARKQKGGGGKRSGKLSISSWG